MQGSVKRIDGATRRKTTFRKSELLGENCRASSMRYNNWTEKVDVEGLFHTFSVFLRITEITTSTRFTAWTGVHARSSCVAFQNSLLGNAKGLERIFVNLSYVASHKCVIHGTNQAQFHV